MITTGKIIAINKTLGKQYTENAYEIEVPLLNAPGDNAQNIQNKHLTATASLHKGFYNMYDVGDVVYIGFMHNMMNQPVILGKIYQGRQEIAAGFAHLKALTVDDNVHLPDNTFIGEYSGIDISHLFSDFELLKDQASSSYRPWTRTTITCINLTTNLYGYTKTSFRAVQDLSESCYYIEYDGERTLTTDQAREYFLYMAGVDALPEPFNRERYQAAFTTTDGRIYYPIWDADSNTLKFHIINDESLDDHIERIIAQHGS